MILVNSLIPAILSGNTVILKPSPQTPTIVERVADIFSAAGLPKGVLQYFHCGSPTVLETIVRDPRIALVCFTGSVAGGLAVQKAAADRIVNVGLELGGKDPAYVRGDVDVDWAAEELVDGAVFNSGQSCCSVERVYVDDKIHDAFVEAVQRVLKGYKLGDPFDRATHVGPVISKRSKEMIEAHIKDALDKGAKDATPPNESFSSPPAKGNFVKPTLLTDVDHKMNVMTQETFGPVIPVMRVKGDEEAVRLMNDSEFGLTASIWTKDTDRGHQLADEVEAGTVFVNRCDYPSPVCDPDPPIASALTGAGGRTWPGRGTRTRARARRWAASASSNLSSQRASTSKSIPSSGKRKSSAPSATLAVRWVRTPGPQIKISERFLPPVPSGTCHVPLSDWQATGTRGDARWEAKTDDISGCFEFQSSLSPLRAAGEAT